ncbi:hypothetical protein CFC21_038205 [Triticum aestivum]|uniref:Mixed lineage kinase domain-containing protein n=3 Tax=Triticum TaxID=4564 RepID=A0A9R0VTR8_TRITD|nr:hypothetical protein CFC21_038205 [Triticum aestivum]VAH69383.1 unnamed protein product [Triticum turgidum subsp. durum]
MADALGSVTKALDIVFKIKEAVDTVKQNEKDCEQIKKRVERVQHTLTLFQQDVELMNSAGSRTALEALREVLTEALELVTGCKEETNLCCLLIKAGEVSKKLNKADQTISNINSEVSLTIMLCIAPHTTKPLKLYQAPDEHGRSLQLVLLGGSFVKQTRSVPPTISEIAVEIKVAVDRVQRNKEECIEVDKRVNGVNALLSQFGNTELMKDPSMSASIEKLHTTFCIARTLVMECQKRNIIFIRSGWELSKQLREVLDQIDLALDDMITISANYACTV